MFEGIVIAFGGLGGGRTFTIRKISFGVGVERCFPLYSPNLEKIEILRSGHTRRAKLYYLRDRVGRSAKLEEKESVGSDSKKAPEQKAAPAVVAEEVLVSAEKK
jgi:large subunit ribosomal protein L19